MGGGGVLMEMSASLSRHWTLKELKAVGDNPSYWWRALIPKM